jgi:hypothetical protein
MGESEPHRRRSTVARCLIAAVSVARCFVAGTAGHPVLRFCGSAVLRFSTTAPLIPSASARSGLLALTGLCLRASHLPPHVALATRALARAVAGVPVRMPLLWRRPE